ncbi:MAG: hypothetical protein JW843_02125 [Candidatus Aminicenantes bacterium]|nr:hypothetical protein [Candidatus Aminicenantes bacterium]
MAQTNPFKYVLVAALVLALGTPGLPAGFAGQSADEILKKTYEKIIGKYAFIVEGQNFFLDFYVRDGNLWGDSGDGRPAIFTPKENSTEEFSADDPETGHFTVAFLKNDKGEYDRCHVVAPDIGLDITGDKIKTNAIPV